MAGRLLACQVGRRLPGTAARRLSQRASLSPLYTHVRSKEDLLDAIADAVIGMIPVGDGAADWGTALRRMALAARGVMLRHRWAPRVIETRTAPGLAALAYINAVLGTLRRAGFSIAQAHTALHLLGSRMLGFSRELFEASADSDPPAAPSLPAEFAAAFPYAAEMALAVAHGGALGPCDDDSEFEFAIDFLIDGLARLRRSPGQSP